MQTPWLSRTMQSLLKHFGSRYRSSRLLFKGFIAKKSCDLISVNKAAPLTYSKILLVLSDVDRDCRSVVYYFLPQAPHTVFIPHFVYAENIFYHSPSLTTELNSSNYSKCILTEDSSLYLSVAAAGCCKDRLTVLHFHIESLSYAM